MSNPEVGTLLLSMDTFICPKCGNDNPIYLGVRNGHLYCRKCIAFNGAMAQGGLLFPKKVSFSISYSLSEDQKDLSHKVNENYLSRKNTLIHAVCGAGKTELVFEVISTALSKGQRVGFAIPRRDVVRELFQRLKSAFPSVSVIGVYGGHHSRIEADIVVLTTHQLYRYENYFDLLIVDEIDAFPFKNNELLQTFFQRSIKGHFVLLSATPSVEMQQKYTVGNNALLELFSRYHGGRLPEPIFAIRLFIFKYLFVIRKLRFFAQTKKPCFVFTPTISVCEEVFSFIRWFVPKGNRVHSKLKERPEIIDAFKDGEYQYLVTTSVLERGVTIRNLQVIVFDSDHVLYDQAALVQISGRVGRKSDAREGEVIFVANRVSESMEKARDEIRFANLHV